MATSDPFGAFCTHTALRLNGASSGPLAGLTFAAKDNFDVANHRTGAGSPDWLRTHAPAARTAPAVQALLNAGATLVGKTNMDELAFSLDGMNFHYGTPTNPATPDRIPGGSSSGSAAATAGKLVDFGLGTDTVGSVRVPASLCGIFGIRPTHGRISLEGIVPLAPSFDTVGWFARDAAMLRRVGEVFFGAPNKPEGFSRCLIADTLFSLADEEVRSAVDAVLPKIEERVGSIERIELSREELQQMADVFSAVRNGEVRAVLGEWIQQTKPNTGPGIRERFQKALAISDEVVADGKAPWPKTKQRLDGLFANDGVLCFPTVPVRAPLRSASDQELGSYRMRTLLFTSMATVGGLPQVSLPLAQVGGGPVGVSFVGATGSDEKLLALAEKLESAAVRAKR
jgi:amidase